MGLRNRQRGDTILEVMICVAVVGLLLSAAFALSNRNTTAEMMAQERSVGVKIAESQLELLKSYADRHVLPDRNMFFCMNSDPASPTGVRPVELTGDASPKPDKEVDIETEYPGACRQQESSFAYEFAIWSPNNSGQIGGTPNIPYAVTVRWDAANAGERQEVKIFYNLYDSSNPAFGVDGLPPNQCSNEIDDNDPEDTLVDYPADPGCISAADNDETNPECNDATDNDRDGRNNYPADPGCSNLQDNSEFPDPPPPPPPPPPPLPRVALWQCYQWYTSTGNPMIRTNHYYTTNPNECQGGHAAGGNRDGIIGYAPLSSNPGAVPMYGGHGAGSVDDFYTTSHGEYISAHNGGWNVNSGIRFYVYPNCSITGTTPIYRWNSSHVGNHFYSTSPRDANWMSPVDGGGTYRYEGIAGCIFSSP